ncbi:hypothetical protein TruAng_008582 [Truncatella angustata]|nr:hypothetical protein TruAng_008582 [Truncatella angustata]
MPDDNEKPSLVVPPQKMDQDDEAVRAAIWDKYSAETRRRMLECLLHLGVGSGPQTPDGMALFVINADNRWIDESPCEPIRKLRFAHWRNREQANNDSMDAERYKKRSEKCLRDQRGLLQPQTQFQEQMAGLCGEEAKDCAWRGELAKEFHDTTMVRMHEYETIGNPDNEKGADLHQLDEDLQQRFDELLAAEDLDLDKCRRMLGI